MYTQKLILTLFLFVALLTGCGLETKTFTEFYKKNLEEVTKIKILDGSTGYSKTITDKKVMNEFLDKIKYIQFIPEENQEGRDGYRYSIALFQDEEMTFSFTLNEVNNNYYYTKPDIYPIVNSFYKNLKVEEK